MLEVREHRSLEEVAPWAADWNALWFGNGHHDVFGTYQWMACWWKCLADQSTRPFILSVWEGEVLRGVAPLMIRRSWFGPLPVRAVEFMSMGKFAGSAASLLGSIDFILGGNADEVLHALLGHLERTGDSWDILRLHPLPEDAASLPQIARWGDNEGRCSVSRAVFENAVLRFNGDWELYRRGLSTKFRARLHQGEAKLKRRGTVEFEEIRSIADLPRAWEEILGIERRSWKWKFGIAITSAAFRGFFREIAESCATMHWLRMGFLRLNGKSIAYTYMALTGETAVFLKTGYDDSLSDCSPGSIAMTRAFQSATREGVLRINMLSGDWDYKQKWEATAEPHREIFVFNRTAYGHLLHGLYFRAGLYEKGRVPLLTFKRILRKCGIPWKNSELTREDQLA